jgi:general secretion pathway protein G
VVVASRSSRCHARAGSLGRTEALAHDGFTLIELMIVMSLIVILASISIGINANAQIRAREAVLKQDLFHMRDAIDQYYADKSAYPPALADLVSANYLRSIPEDPFTNASDTWQLTMSPPQAAMC